MYSGVESTVPGGWLDQMEIRLTSASVEVKVELRLSLAKGKMSDIGQKGGEGVESISFLLTHKKE